MDEFDFADGAQFLGAVGAVAGAGFDEYGGADVVAGVEVGGEFGEEVALIVGRFGAVFPEVVMGVADGDFGFQGVLGG